MLFVHKALAALVLPPLGPILLLFLGAFSVSILPRFGRFVFFFAVLSMLGLALPSVADVLQWPAEAQFPPVTDAAMKGAGAIVVLGGGRVRGAAEYGGETLAAPTLRRVRYAALLVHRTGLPLLVSGGKPAGGEHSEAALMAEALKSEFAVPVKWLEPDSVDTAANAAFTAKILLPLGLRSIVLVTDVSHMGRARREFQSQGFLVIPAPVDFRGHHEWLWLDFIPSAGAYERSSWMLHEWLGDLWISMSKNLKT